MTSYSEEEQLFVYWKKRGKFYSSRNGYRWTLYDHAQLTDYFPSEKNHWMHFIAYGNGKFVLAYNSPTEAGTTPHPLPIVYNMDVSNSVYSLSDVLQPRISFSAGNSYIFNQSDPTNAGEQIVFGREFDNKTNLYKPM